MGQFYKILRLIKYMFCIIPAVARQERQCEQAFRAKNNASIQRVETSSYLYHHPEAFFYVRIFGETSSLVFLGTPLEMK
jgi:hypothetical protein